MSIARHYGANVVVGEGDTVVGIGDELVVVSGPFGHAVAHDDGIAYAANGTATVQAGDDGVLLAEWVDHAGRTRVAVAYVGEDGIEPDTAYRLEDGKFVEADWRWAALDDSNDGIYGPPDPSDPAYYKRYYRGPE